MRSVLLLLGSVLLACGNTPDPAAAAGGGGGGSGGASGGSPGASAGLAGEASMPGGAAGNGGSSASGGSAGSAGGALEEQPLLPLVPGHVSSFVFTPIDDSKPMNDTCADPTTSIASGEGLAFDGHEGALYFSFCSPEPFLIEGEGDSLTAYEINDGALVLPAFNYIHSPVVTGEMWDSGRGDQYTWQDVGEPVETPAGTFAACFHRYGADTQITYCRGVGVVRALAESANYQLDLVQKNF